MPKALTTQRNVHQSQSHGRCSSCLTAQELLKDHPKLCVEGCVDDGVHGAVDVTQPGHHADQCWPDVTGHAENLGHVNHKERGPARQKYACGRRTQVI